MISAFLLPDNVIIMPEKEALFVISHVVNNPNAGNKIHKILVSIVKEIIAALVTTVPVNPFQTKLAVWCSLVCHPADSQREQLLW